MDQDMPPQARPTPGQGRDRRQIDGEHLKLLSIFHFVGFGLAVLGLFASLAGMAMFSAIGNNPAMWQNQPNPPPAEVFGAAKLIYGVMALWTGGSAVLNLLAGIFLRARRHRVFVLIVGGLNCLHIPLGTVLGVFTLVVLLRDSVRPLFDEAGTPS
jgi:hypothetical protein